MKKSGKKPSKKIVRPLGALSDALLYRKIPDFLMEIAGKYFRLQVEGVENIPKRGPAIIAPNHSGVSGFDAMLLAHEITKAAKRRPRVLTHHFWFLTPTTSIPAERLGFIEATMENGLRALHDRHLMLIFPEGEYGNFKPSNKAYTLQEFRRGFIRMALLTGAPIIPTIVIGAEETHINLSRIKLSKFLRGLVIPLPLNVIPLPTKWKIHFLEPILLPYRPEAAKDRELVRELTEDLQDKMQSRLQVELDKRDGIFF